MKKQIIQTAQDASDSCTANFISNSVTVKGKSGLVSVTLTSS